MQGKNILAIFFNGIKCHVTTSFGLVGGMHPMHPFPCVRACLAPLLFGNFSVYCRWITSVWHFRCVLHYHTFVFLVLIFVLYVVVSAARQIRSSSYGLLHIKTCAVWHLSYLAFCRLCGDEPSLFVTSDVCCIATLLFFVLIFVLCIVVSAARQIPSSSFGLLHTKTSAVWHPSHLAFCRPNWNDLSATCVRLY